METYSSPTDPLAIRLEEVGRHFPSLEAGLDYSLCVYDECLNIARNDEKYIDENPRLQLAKDIEEGILDDNGYDRNARVYRYVPQVLYTPGARERLEECHAFQLAYLRLALEMATPDQEIQDRVGTFKSFLALKLIDPTSKYDVIHMVRKKGFSQIVDEFDKALSEASADEQAIVKAELVPFFEELVDRFVSPDKSKVLNVGRLKGVFNAMFQKRYHKHFLRIYEDIPTLHTMTRVDIYGIDSTLAEDLADEIGVIKEKGKGINSKQHLTLQSKALELIVGTISSAGKTYGIENAKKIVGILEGNKTKLNERTGVTTVTFSNIIQLANGLLSTINNVIDNPEQRLLPLENEMSSMTEAFRRIMFVVFDGNETDPRAEELNMVERFQAVDEFISVHEMVSDKANKNANDSRSRGKIPIKGQTYWKRWQTGYGVIS